VNSSSRCARRDRDPFVDHVEDRVTHQQVLLARLRRARQLEPPGVELFVTRSEVQTLRQEPRILYA
jgi:hypothetical protein